jgi:hypothetical protein
MGVGAFRRNRITSGVARLVLPALLLRLLVPAGFMPGVDEDDSLTMQMCHGNGSASLALPAPGTTERGESSADHGSPCLYAATSVTAPPPVATGAAQPASVPGPSRTTRAQLIPRSRPDAQRVGTRRVRASCCRER